MPALTDIQEDPGLADPTSVFCSVYLKADYIGRLKSDNASRDLSYRG